MRHLRTFPKIVGRARGDQVPETGRATFRVWKEMIRMGCGSGAAGEPRGRKLALPPGTMKPGIALLRRERPLRVFPGLAAGRKQHDNNGDSDQHTRDG